jgi:selenide,water dikinase
VSGGTKRNAESVAPHVTFAPDVDPVLQILLADAQTSGGLLIAVPAERADLVRAALESEGTPAAAVIGAVTAGEPGRIAVA